MGFLGFSPPSFRRNDTILYYLLRHGPGVSSAELWRLDVKSGESEAVFPGISMLALRCLPGRQTSSLFRCRLGRQIRFWLALADRSPPARIVGDTGGLWSHFGAQGQILFQVTGGNSNYLEQIKRDGPGGAKVALYPINDSRASRRDVDG